MGLWSIFILLNPVILRDCITCDAVCQHIHRGGSAGQYVCACMRVATYAMSGGGGGRKSSGPGGERGEPGS